LTVHKHTFIRTLVLAAAAIGCSPLAHAGVITVFNPSFEDPAMAPGTYTQGPGGITFWTNNNASGVFNPGIGVYFNYIPDGDQVAYNLGAAAEISQILGDTLQNSTTYTLQVEAAHRLDYAVDWAPIVELLAGSTVIATAPLPADPGQGNWATVTATYTSGASDALAGQALQIVLGADATNLNNYDNVRLTSAGALSTPEPATWALFSTGLLAFFARRRRK
jgi:hypothetical protein